MNPDRFPRESIGWRAAASSARGSARQPRSGVCPWGWAIKYLKHGDWMVHYATLMGDIMGYKTIHIYIHTYIYMYIYMIYIILASLNRGIPKLFLDILMLGNYVIDPWCGEFPVLWQYAMWWGGDMRDMPVIHLGWWYPMEPLTATHTTDISFFVGFSHLNCRH